MPAPKELMVDAGFGETWDSAILLAVHPDERSLPNTLPSTGRRTFVLKATGGKVEFVQTIPAPLVQAWRSDSGTAYCSPVRGNFLYTFYEGKWEKVTISDTEEQINFIWGFSGKMPEEDIVFACASEALLIKQKGVWKKQAAPKGSSRLSHAHGLSPQEVYVCGGGKLLLWDGKKLKALEGPEENDPETVWVLSETEMMAGADLLFCWTEESGWEIVETALRSFFTFLALDGKLFSAISEVGVARFKDGKPELVTEKFDCVRICSLGNGILAVGWNCSSYLFDGKAWKKLALPLCEKGLLPKK